MRARGGRSVVRRALAPAAALMLAGLFGIVGVPGVGGPAGTLPPAGAAPAPTACQQAPRPGVSIPPLAPRDPLIGGLGLDHAWPLTRGAGVTVGIVDTGVDASSPKLAGAVDLGRTYRVVDTKAVYTSTPDGRVDCDGHGTEIAGIIAGRTDAGDDRVSGIAPAATIYPVAVQGDISQAPSALIAAAIRDAAAHASVLNLSFAQTTDSPDIRAAVKYALDRNVVVVAASANESGGATGGPSATWYPAAYPGVLAVAAVDAQGAPESNGSTGGWISIAAPGDSLTTVPRGGKGYVTVTGTSFATAVVSGTAALVRARFPNLSAPGVIARLERTAVPPGDGGRDDAVGYGIVDPFAALTDTSPASPSTAASTGRPARVPVLALPTPRPSNDRPDVLGLSAVLVALAVLVGVATLAVRSGRRRGWHAGPRPRAPVDDRDIEPHPAELG